MTTPAEKKRIDNLLTFQSIKMFRYICIEIQTTMRSNHR